MDAVTAVNAVNAASVDEASVDALAAVNYCCLLRLQLTESLIDSNIKINIDKKRQQQRHH